MVATFLGYQHNISSEGLAVIIGFVLAVIPVYAPAPRPQQVVLICPKCASHIPVDCKFCPECGADLRPKKRQRK